MSEQLTYSSALEQAQLAMRNGKYAEAETLLQRAHGLGHSVKADHLRAHRALMKLGLARKNPLQVASQFFLLCLAWVFERA